MILNRIFKAKGSHIKFLFYKDEFQSKCQLVQSYLVKDKYSDELEVPFKVHLLTRSIPTLPTAATKKMAITHVYFIHCLCYQQSQVTMDSFDLILHYSGLQKITMLNLQSSKIQEYDDLNIFKY